MTRKNILRKRHLKARSALPLGTRKTKNRDLADLLFMFPPIRDARKIMVYHAIKGEADPSFLTKRYISEGRKISLPVILKDRHRLVPRCFTGRKRECVYGRYGILQPHPDRSKMQVIHSLDAVLVPGIAFNFNGFRVGFGGGYYDRFLRSLPVEIFRIGIAYEQQVIHTRFEEAHDSSLDTLVTEKAIYLFSEKAQKTLKY